MQGLSVVCSPGLFLVPCLTLAWSLCPGSESHPDSLLSIRAQSDSGLSRAPWPHPAGNAPPQECTPHSPPVTSALGTPHPKALAEPWEMQGLMVLTGISGRGGEAPVQGQHRGRALAKFSTKTRPLVAASLTQHLLSPAPPQAFLRRAAEPPTERMLASKPSSFSAEL